MQVLERFRYWAGIFVPAVVVGLIVVLIVSSMSRSDISELRNLVLAGASIVGIVVVIFVPARYLPSLALVSFILLPPSMMPNAFKVIVPGTIILWVWVVRRKVSFGSVAVLGFFWGTALFSVASAAFSVDSASSGTWILTFFMSLIPALIVSPSREERDLLEKTFLCAAGFLGLYGILEFLTKRNLVYGALQSLFGSDFSVQHWSTYRPTMTFGHPIPAAAFMAVATAIVMAIWMQRRTVGTGVVLLLSLSGLVVPQTRGGIFAFGFAALVAVAFAMFTQRASKWRARLLGLCAICIIALLFVSAHTNILSRFQSGEALSALVQRQRTFPIILDAIGGMDHPFGLGPGVPVEVLGGDLAGLGYVENFYLQALLGLGWLGAIFLFAFMGSIFWSAWRSQYLGGVLGLLAFFAVIATFNAFDGYSSIFVLFSVLIMYSKSADQGLQSDGAGRLFASG